MAPLSATLERDVSDLRSKITETKADAATKRKAAEALVEDEKKAGRNPVTGTSDEDKDSFARIDAAYKEADECSELAADYENRLHRLLDHAGDEARESTGGDPDHPETKRAASMGALVLASEPYQRLIKSGKLDAGGNAPNVELDPVQVLTREQAMGLWRAGRMLFLADAGDGSPLVPDDQQLVPPVPIPVRQPTVLELVTVGSTDSDLVKYTVQTLRDNNAAPTAFGTASPKSRYTYEQRSADVRRIPHHVVADKGNLADQAQFRTIIESDLVEDLRLVVEEQVVAGSGLGQNLEGIYNADGIGDQPQGADTAADAAHKAMTVVRIALEREPTAWGIHPVDFEAFWLEKGDDGHYLHHRGPQEMSVKTMWGLPAVISTVFTEDLPVVADWKRAYTLWQRAGIMVEASDNVDDFFLEGLVAVQATTRVAGATKQPRAVCTVSDFAVGS